MEKCECGGVVADRNGLRVCVKCGLVQEVQIVTDEKFYTPPELFAHSPIELGGTLIKIPFSPRTVSEAEMSRRLKRIAVKRQYTSRERNVFRAIKTLSFICEQISLPAYIQIEIKKKYKEAMHRKLIKYGEEATMAAIIYLVCNKLNYPIQMEDICRVIYGPETEDRRTRKSAVISTRRVVNDLSNSLNLPYTLENPVVYLNKIRNAIGMSYKIESKVREFILKHWGTHNSMSGHLPHIVAGAAVAYILKKEGFDPPFKQISNSISVTEVSIRKIIKQFEDSAL